MSSGSVIRKSSRTALKESRVLLSFINLGRALKSRGPILANEWYTSTFHSYNSQAHTVHDAITITTKDVWRLRMVPLHPSCLAPMAVLLKRKRVLNVPDNASGEVECSEKRELFIK